jgi:hypothetical protein
MKQKRFKHKINTKNKSYELRDSPLYKINTKRKLCSILGADLAEIKSLCLDEGNYSVFEQMGKNGKPRTIEHPNETLDKIHSRIASLLCRIRTPEYLHSGIKQRSYVSNAKAHLNGREVLTVDIKSYYQSTKRELIYQFFRDTLKCAPDVSFILSELTTFEGHIPTGSRVSMPLAFWSNINMFSQISNLASEHNLNLSVYVDDLTFSGDSIPRSLIFRLKYLIMRHGHVMHPKKTKLYKDGKVKIITGVAIRDGHLLIKNSQHKNITADIIQWIGCRDGVIPKSLRDRLVGRLNAMSVIEPWLKDKARSIKNYNSLIR